MEVRTLLSPDHIPHEEEEGISGRGAKVFAINRHLEAKCTHYINRAMIRNITALIKRAQWYE